MKLMQTRGVPRIGALLVAAACGASSDRSPPPVASGTATGKGGEGTGSGAMSATGEAESGLAGGGFAHCQPLNRPDDSDSTDASAFKFDVGVSEDEFTFEFGCDEAPANRTNLGCEFWAVDLPNDDRGTFMSPPAADQQFAVAVGNPSGLQPAQVRVYLPAQSVPFASARVEPLETHTFALPPASIDPNAGSTDGQAYRVTSDTPIVAYQFNPLDNTTPVYSNDASLLLPVHALGNDYLAVTGSAILLSMGQTDAMPRNAGAFVSVVATVDGTQVEFAPTAPLAGGLASGVVLDAGEVWTLVSRQDESQAGNLSGTQVTSTAPVAVFAGNVATVEPLAAFACCADHLEHQLYPRTAWGSRYAVAPPPSVRGTGSDAALYRITGAFDDTVLQYCPVRPQSAPTSLAAGQTVEFTTDQPFTVAAADPDKAFGVAQFLLSNEALAPIGLGDPAMLVVPSALQLERRFAFVVPAGYQDNRVTVVALGDPVVTLDGEPLDPAEFEPLGVLDQETFRFAHLRVAEGQHIVEGRGRVGVFVYGYDEAVSFAYPGGAGLRVVSIPPIAG